MMRFPKKERIKRPIKINGKRSNPKIKNKNKAMGDLIVLNVKCENLN